MGDLKKHRAMCNLTDANLLHIDSAFRKKFVFE